jgi:recombination protein RecA
MGVEARDLEKSGSWYAYNGEKIGQGKDNAREFLKENPTSRSRSRTRFARRSASGAACGHGDDAKPAKLKVVKE